MKTKNLMLRILPFTIAEAEALTKTDPAINAGRLIMELKEWYGPAALIAVNDIHEKLVQPN